MVHDALIEVFVQDVKLFFNVGEFPSGFLAQRAQVVQQLVGFI
jgi:hypothetical protein